MFYFLSLLTGVIITVLIAVNGGLTGQYGVYSATIIIHIAGLIFITLLVLAKRELPFANIQAWHLYLGGALGVLTTAFINLAFGRISVSAILALGLLGQSIAGLVFDRYGLMGMQKHPSGCNQLIGLTLILAGIVAMVTQFEVVAVTVAFITGINIVVARNFNAKLAEHTSVRTSTFYNYVVGLGVAVLAYLLLGRQELVDTGWVLYPYWWIYLGGIIGVCVVLLSNITVVKISAFYLSLLMFIGQVFSGIVVDAVISQAFSSRNMVGGVLVTLGLCINLVLDRQSRSRITFQPTD